jgi:predicted nucleic acid-binding protein
MSANAEVFIDTNVLLYLLSGDESKADRAEDVVAQGGIVSVQVLNEFASVATRKLAMSIAETRETLAVVRSVCAVVPMSEETHDLGMQLADRLSLSVWDAMIIAAARLAGCATLLSEDMQDGMRVDGALRIRNPFLR